MGTGEAGFSHLAVYRVFSNGTMQVDNKIKLLGSLPILPRLGVNMVLSQELNQLQWYGLGPHETYPDRKSGAYMGVFQGTVAEQYVPYVRPQETGNKEAVRWAALLNDAGSGLLVIAGKPLSMTALHYSAMDLDRADHIHELAPREQVYLSLDSWQLGLGNGSCGPGVIDKYKKYPASFDFSFALRPYTPGMGSLTGIACQKIPGI